MSYGTIQIEKMTTESGYSLGAGNASSFKNRLINGGMVIDQRNAGSAVTFAAGGGAVAGYPVDRFECIKGNAGGFTAQRSTVAPAGFINSTLITVTTANTPAATDYAAFRQMIEGLNVTDLGWGTADAKTITLSFWIRCSVTGTYNWSFMNGAENRGYVSSFTVNSANTWEYKTLTVPGDTSGTWLTTNGVGVRILFDLGTGSTYSTTAGSWQTFNFAYGLTGGTKFISNAGATLYITGVQFEVGTVATSFDFRSYGTELALCQRYAIQDAFNGSGVVRATTTTATITVSLPVRMRTTPTMTNISNGATDGFASQVTTGASGDTLNPLAPNILVTTSSSMGSQGFGVSMRSQTILFSAEL